jgi:hypothetical protein
MSYILWQEWLANKSTALDYVVNGEGILVGGIY